MKGKLFSLSKEGIFIVARWTDNADGRTHKIKFYDYSRREAINVLRYHYKVSVSHNFY